MIPLVSAYCEAKYAYGMNHKKRNLLLLSIAYAANIGGTGIITGSPPNLLVLTHLKAQYILRLDSDLRYSLALLHPNSFLRGLFWAEIESTLHVALPKQPINYFS